MRGKPLIVGGTSSRGVVASCSYEARKFGIHSAMPIKMAKRLCPDVQILRGDMDTYSHYSKLVTDIIASEAPLFEKSSIDEFYLDLSGMDRYVGCYKWSKELRSKITKHTGLPNSFGLSINKLVSKVGTGEAKPSGTIQIDKGHEKTFLAPLSVAKIPSVGNVTYRKLSLMGVRTIKTLSEIPPKLLQREFGKTGTSLWKKANGIDDRLVIPYHEKKSISTERTFQVDTIDIVKLKAILTGMVSKLAFQLRSSQKLTACVVVKIRYSDFNTYSKQKKIPYTSNDNTLFSYVDSLFDQLYQRRQLIRLVGIKFTGLVSGNHQINLFDDTIRDTQLQQQVDRIKKRFGQGVLMKASAMK